MEIRHLLEELKKQNLLVFASANAPDIRAVVYDSRAAGKDALFICKGAAFEEKYLHSAVQKGAVCYMSEKAYSNVNCAAVIVRDIRKAMALTGAIFYENPAEKLDLIGITGTKGKTTTSFIVRTLLEQAGKSYGLLSSVLTDTGKHCQAAHLTTPESLDLQCMFSEMVDSNFSGAIMEVSSQGLQYDRVYGISYNSAAFLNIGQDHISPIEHKDFDEYFGAKQRIFKQTGHAVINRDDALFPQMLAAAKASGCRIVTYGFMAQADLYAYNVKREGNRTTFRVKTADFDRHFSLPLLGAFNVYNTLAALGLCYDRVTVSDMVKGVRKVRVPGRMEVFGDEEDVVVLVDYAHNKMSFENLFSSVRKEFPGRRIISIYGCPGGKAHLRRQDLGLVSGQLADFTILTAEDPNYEDVEQINREIGLSIQEAGGRYTSVPDRALAIEQAILTAKTGDVIVITGKGEETFQKIGGDYADYAGDIPLTKMYLQKRRDNRRDFL